jgi:hypothetical protein
MNNVRSYQDIELLTKVAELPGFSGFPKDCWLIAVRSKADSFNHFDDKFYLFRGEQFIAVWKGTTNAGADLLDPTNPRGEAVLKSDEIYYDAWERRLHRGKVLAWCQRLPLPIYRDNDRDTKTEELGEAKSEIVGINIHPASYLIGSKVERELIQNWSMGCMVLSIRADFDELMKYTKGQKYLTMALLREW